MKNILETLGTATLKVGRPHGQTFSALRKSVRQNRALSLVVTSTGTALLEEIRDEVGLNQAGEQAAREERIELAEHDKDEGLTTEINTSRTLVDVADTIRSLVMVLSRHPFGDKGTIRGARGEIKRKPFTPEEDAAAEEWAAGPKRGKEWALTGKLSDDCWTGGE